ncbi:pyridoxamine 5'-phosphate oxidase family protein [Microbispora sp. NEAU-D428]|nr:pyridoxamine 5'-phosphate oxidase family protein [Microbispora sitophila]
MRLKDGLRQAAAKASGPFVPSSSDGRRCRRRDGNGRLAATPVEIIVEVQMTEDTAPAGMPRLDKLEREECLRLISPGGVGRVAFNNPTGPVILPVNYTIEQGAILFRTALGGPMDADLRTGIEGADFMVAFEVDHIDESTREGWSVLVRGGAHHITGDVNKNAVESWAGGDRPLYIRISPNEVSGRRIQHA